MATELRLLTLEERPLLRPVMSEAFGRGSRPDPNVPPPTLDPDKKYSPVLGIFDGSRLVAAATVHDLRLTWGETDAPAGGIAGVACVADQRGRGHVARLLEESLRQMKDAGQYLSALFPFAFAFYRKFGWEWVGEKRMYTIPTAEIKATSEGKNLRCYDGPDALETVRPIYDAYVSRRRGMSTRTEQTPDFWKQALDHKDNRTTYVHVYHAPGTDTPEGYLTFRYPSGDTGNVGDFFANTPEAYRGLLSVLHYYGTQLKKVQFNAPADDPFPLHAMHWDLETRIEPLFMGRVVDVTAALSALQPSSNLAGKLTLQTSDPHCDWNNKTFAITVEAGRVSVQETNASADIAMDIQALTQAYWGQPALQILRTAGRLTVASEVAYTLLAQILPPTVCYFKDDF